MNLIMASLTVAFLSICGPQEITIEENLEITKPSNSTEKENIIYKKVPTKWVKITKKSN